MSHKTPIFHHAYVYSKIIPFCNSALLNTTPRSNFMEESQAMRYIA
jgi:hypothetical protein